MVFGAGRDQENAVVLQSGDVYSWTSSTRAPSLRSIFTKLSVAVVCLDAGQRHYVALTRNHKARRGRMRRAVLDQWTAEASWTLLRKRGNA